MKAKMDELTEKAGHAIRENVAHIIFGVVILLMVVISFVEMGAGDGTVDWFGLTVNITCSCPCLYRIVGGKSE